MSGTSRDPGWYADPWGTDDERYFDGGAWTRSVRRPGGLDTPPVDYPLTPPGGGATIPAATVEAPQAASPSSAQAIPTGAQTAPPGAPPGWHPDPWAAAALRYWDGRQWTGHVAGMPGGPAATLRLTEERTAARWARLGMAVAGPALGVCTIAAAFQWNWIADHWDEITAPGSTVSSTNGNSGAAVVGQLGAVALVVGIALFMIWFHRSAVVAASSGLRARRSAGLATASFIIPILNLWWPYQSTCDLLPENSPARPAVRRWWALWIACFIGCFAVIFAAFVDPIALAITAAATVVLALLAAIAARAVVSEITDAHDTLLAGT